MIRVLSLGAGVQSSTVLMMSITGELPKLDHAIFADTGWEPKAVYAHLDWLEQQAAAAGIQVHRVHKSNLRDDALRFQVRGKKTEHGRWASLPYFTRDRTTGKPGMIRRQCTFEYKIQPITRKLREVAGLKPRQRGPKSPIVEQWFGISADEPQRMRDPDHVWIQNFYPLIYGPRRMRRGDCLAWMAERGYPTPPRSACIGCPFHSDNEWRQLRDSSPEEWAEAVAFDAAIRTCGGMRGDVFLHAQRVPLDQVDLSTAEDRGQVSLFDNECAGVCGV